MALQSLIFSPARIAATLLSIVGVAGNSSYFYLASAPDGGGAAAPNDDHWHPITIAALCPTATSALRIDLRHSGSGQAYFRTITLHSIALVDL